MTSYEALYILKNDCADEAKEAVVKKFEDIVTSRGGVVDNTDVWGTKRYAYPIDYQNEGYYVLMNFTAGVDVPEELERQIRILPEGVRIMILKK